MVRAFGGKDALLDAAVSGLLEPVVHRAGQLLDETRPERALRTFLTELIAFQSAHHAIGDQLGSLELPATTALRKELVRAVEEMVARAQRDGAIRADLDPAVITTLIGQTAYAIARAQAQPASEGLAAAYITVVMDGLRPGQPGPGGDTKPAAAQRAVTSRVRSPVAVRGRCHDAESWERGMTAMRRT